MHLSSGTASQLCTTTYEQLGIYRRQVFVERLGWELRTPNGQEQDQFDRPDTVYLVARDENSAIIGCARLLPTTEPYLLSEVFPQLFNGLKPPSSPDIWELSRFAAVDLNTKPESANFMQFSASIAAKLLGASIECAKSHGAKHLVSVSPVGVERLIRKSGYKSHRAGPPMVVAGSPIFACWVDFD